MRTIEINLPDGIELTEHDLKMHFACRLYEQEVLSTGLCARVVGISRREFIESMGKYGTSIFHGYTVEDLKHDIEVIHDLEKSK